jgi:phenylacetic acid degradation operon negative regulatory protein
MQPTGTTADVATDGGAGGPATTPRSRTVLVTYLGSVVRPMGDWMPISGTVDLMTQVGLDAPSVRTAVFRLKKRGWLVSETRAGVRGYALSDVALAALAAGDEVVWHTRQPAELGDGWCVVSFSVPESARAKRHKLRSRLSSLGFGNMSTAVWVAPARMQPAAERAIDELGLADFSAIFVGSHAGGQELSTLVNRSWDLSAIDHRYREFISQFAPRAVGLESGEPADAGSAFAMYLELVDQWRKLPFRDPGLPKSLLLSDWSEPEAGALFERCVTLLKGRALAHAASQWPERSDAPD